MIYVFVPTQITSSEVPLGNAHSECLEKLHRSPSTGDEEESGRLNGATNRSARGNQMHITYFKQCFWNIVAVELANEPRETRLRLNPCILSSGPAVTTPVTGAATAEYVRSPDFSMPAYCLSHARKPARH